MSYDRKDVIIGYFDKFVGGYSFKAGKVYFKKTQEEAKKFTPIQADAFILTHANKNGCFLTENINLIRLNWKEKFAK